MSSASDLADLLQACRAQPASAPLLRALLAEAARATDPSPAIELLCDLPNERFGDPALRRTISDLLFKAGKADSARRWARADEQNASNQVGSVIDLGTRRAASQVNTSQVLRFTEVGGLDEAKRQIRRRIIAPMQRPGLFRKFQRRAGGGVLLYGPPWLRQDLAGSGDRRRG